MPDCGILLNIKMISLEKIMILLKKLMAEVKKKNQLDMKKETIDIKVFNATVFLPEKCIEMDLTQKIIYLSKELG